MVRFPLPLVALLAAFSVAIGAVSTAGAYSQGPNVPSMAVNDPSVGTVPWLDVWCDVGGCSAIVNAIFPIPGILSQYLKATAFGFMVPDGAVIEGIQVGLDRMGTLVWDDAARIVKAGNIGTADRSFMGGYPNGEWPLPPGAVAQYGGPNDLWGETWTAAAINDPNFGFALSVRLFVGPDYGLGIVDSISITVFYSLCGDNQIGPSEQCDDGNILDGDCCSATCQYEAPGSPCTAPDDGNVCTDNVCDGAGNCSAQANSASCDDGIFCNGTDTCGSGACVHSGDPCLSGPFCAGSCNEIADDCLVPAGTPCPSDDNPCTVDTCDGSGGCGQLPTGCMIAGRSLLLLKNNATDDTEDKLYWQWLKGPSTTLGDLGSPTSTTNYTLCLYSGTSSASVALPAGSTWQAAGTKGFKFKDPSGSPDGAQRAVLKSGEAGKAKALVKGKGTNLPDTLVPALPLPVTVQLVNDTNNVCFEAVFESADVIKNDSNQFKAKAQ